MTIELKPEQEQIIRHQLASGLYGSVEEVLDPALASILSTSPNRVWGAARQKMRSSLWREL